MTQYPRIFFAYSILLALIWTASPFPRRLVAERSLECGYRINRGFVCAKSTKLYQVNEERTEDLVSNSPEQNEQLKGYISSDLGNLDDSKQLRVFAYIALALIPCLFLIPFFLSRDFVPPIDPEAFNQ